MPLHPEARALLDLMAELGTPAVETQTPDQAREARRQLAPPVLEPCFETVDVDADGIPARLYRPRPAAGAPPSGRPGLLVWLHGGGWVVGDLDTHDNVCHALARRSGHAVLGVAYRLAPEHPFPTGLDDSVRATRWAHAHADALGVDPDRIAVGGDSAGANLAASVCHAAPVPLRSQILVYPVTDARGGTASYAEHAADSFLTASAMRWYRGHYLSGNAGNAEDPRVSPLLAADGVVAAGPPALVVTAGFDPLRDEGIAYADRLAELGVPTSHVHFPAQSHAFYSMPHLLADARLAHALTAEALAVALAAPR
jgi:acetyl esterase